MATDGDRAGLDTETNPNHLAQLVGLLVPQSLARRGLTVRIETDRPRYATGEPIEITVEVRNRLPVPVTIETPTRRLWGWSVNGYLEASDELRYRDGGRGNFEFRGRERKRFQRIWDGRVKRVGEPTRWEQATGEVEVQAFLPLRGRRPTDVTTVRIG